jgi:hypothetical protein
VRRVINGGMGVIFKGSGFYSTDNKRGSALSGSNGSSKDKERSSESSKDTSSSSSEQSSVKPSEKSASMEKTPAS